MPGLRGGRTSAATRQAVQNEIAKAAASAAPAAPAATFKFGL